MFKDCNTCLYTGICKNRKEDTSIKDCYIPEAPLRKLQREAVSIEQYIHISNDWVREKKAQSSYWKTQI